MPKNRVATWFLVSLMPLWIGLAAAEPPEPEVKVARPLTPEPQPAKQPPAPEGEVEALVGRGVVVELVGKSSALEKAGLRPGDVVYRWRRLPNPPANPVEASGEFESPFDWREVEVEQAQRGRLLLSGTRNREGLTLVVESGEWNTTVRPQLRPHTLDLYTKLSTALLQGRSTARALSLWRALERKPEELPNSAERLWLSHWFAGELWHHGSPEKGLSLVARALQSGQNPEIRAALLELAGDILEQLGAPQKAEEKFLEALRVRSTPRGLSLAEAQIHSRLGTFYLYQGKLDQAEQHYRVAMDFRAKLAPGSMDFAASVNNLGVLANEREDFETALRYFKEALELRSSLALGSSSEGQSLYNVGLIYAKMDAENLSEEFFRRALRLFDRVDPKSLRVAMTLNCLGVRYLDLQDLDLARFYFEEALGILREVAPESLDTADTLTNLGHIFLRERNFSKAERHFSEALSMQRKLAPGGRAIANNLNNLGITLGEKGNFSRSLAKHREALQVLGKIAPQGAEVASNLYNIGVLYAERKNHSNALEFLGRSLSLRERLIPDSYILAETYAALGKLARDTGDLLTADAWYAKAVRVLEQQILFVGSARIGTVPLRTSREEIYRGALSVATRRGDAEKVLELLERHRGIQLAEMISRREDSVLDRLPADVASQLRELQKRYEEISMTLEALTGREIAQKSGALTSSLSEIQRRYSETIESARSRGGSTFAFRYPRRFTSSDLAKDLQPGQGLLYFFIVDGELWSLLVLDNLQMNLRHHSLNARDLKDKIERLRSLAQSDHGNAVIEASESAARDRMAEELYDSLIKPVEATLTPLSRLLIIPDGPLHLLPWGSLIRSYTKGGETRSQYLAEWKPLHLVLSGTVYSELQKSRPRSDGASASPNFVAFADPKYPVDGQEEKEEKSKGMAAFGDRSTVRPHLLHRQRLLFSRQEVEGIARLFPSEKTKVYLGEEATEERAKAIGDGVRIIHFATHAQLDDRFPLNSALVLTMPEGLSEDRENGLLQVWEIFEQVRLHADLVVLSGCETALGEEQGGEGLLGLTRAFQFAGARSVLASLWSVNDQATSELMIRFYKHLLAGLPKDQALQAAQRELIAGPIEITTDKGERVLKDYRAPYYWAGFQLYGDWQ